MTERTPQPDDGDAVRSLRQLATAIGRSLSTAQSWTAHPDWPFERAAPWSRDEVPKMIAWADTNLRRDKDDDHERIDRLARKSATSGFWNVFDPTHDAPLPTPGKSMIFPDDIPALPATVATPAELAILAGGPLPWPDAIRKIIRANVLARGRLAALPKYLPGWLAGTHGDELRDRIAAAINEHVVYCAESIGETLEPPTTRKRRRKAAAKGGA